MRMAIISLLNSGMRGLAFDLSTTCRKLFKRFKQIELPKGANILDAGCGSGTPAHFWKEQGYTIIGADTIDQSLGITRDKGVCCVKWDVTKRLPFGNNTFDLIYSDSLLEHFVDPKPALDKLFRVSRRYVVTLVLKIRLYNWIHNIILRQPKEYKKKYSEWVKLYNRLNPKSIKVKQVRFRVLMILCEKG